MSERRRLYEEVLAYEASLKAMIVEQDEKIAAQAAEITALQAHVGRLRDQNVELSRRDHLVYDKESRTILVCAEIRSRLEARCARLKEALKPFAYPTVAGDMFIVNSDDVNVARAALKDV